MLIIYHFSELKRRVRDKPAQVVAIVKATDAVKEEEIPPNEYFKLRSLAVQKMKKMGENPFPPPCRVDLSLKDFVNKYKHLSAGEVVESEVHSIAGEGKHDFVFFIFMNSSL